MPLLSPLSATQKICCQAVFGQIMLQNTCVVLFEALLSFSTKVASHIECGPKMSDVNDVTLQN